MSTRGIRPVAAKGLSSASGGMRAPTVGNGKSKGVPMPADNSNMGTDSMKVNFSAGKPAGGKRGSRGF